MKILYISSTSSGMHSHGIYFDLFKELSDMGNDVTIAYAREFREKKQTQLYSKHGIRYLGIKSPNMTKNKNLIEKGFGVLTIDYFFLKAIKNNFNDEYFDLVVYSTPPITFSKTLRFFEKKGSFLYLMLKDIFPQNGVDLQLFSKRSIIYRYFKSREIKLYNISNLIGVMSKANKNFLLKNNQHLNLENKTIIVPNAIKVKKEDKSFLTRDHFGLPDDLILLYGGNLGLPQDANYIKKCIIALEEIEGVTFVICGQGSDSESVKQLILDKSIKNTRYLGNLPTDDYNELTNLSDVGLIFLDHRFTIPNYPQRILSYLEAKIPVICSTDPNTDVGTDAEENGYGISLESNNIVKWIEAVKELRDNPDLRISMGINGYNHLVNNFNVEIIACNIIKEVSLRK